MSHTPLNARDVAADLSALRSLLDAVVAEQSPTAATAVDDAREAATAYRAGEADSLAPVATELAALDATEQNVLARALTTQFQLTNLAEERERVRTIRESRQDGSLDGTIRRLVDRLEADGADAETVQRALEDTLVQPTFTAHPTEARRKTVKAKLRSVAESLATLDEHRLTDDEARRVERDIEAEVTSLWRTRKIRDRPPEVTDEALNVQWYLENTLFDVIGDVYGDLEAAVGERYPSVEVSKLFEFRSWAGSDRDGNPYVTPEVTEETLSRQRRVVLDRYATVLGRLSGVLSQSDTLAPIGEDVHARIDDLAEALPSAADEALRRYPNEPYRQLLRLMREQIQRVGDVRPGGYDDADAFAADLALLDSDLRATGAEVVADAHVAPLRRQAATFEFSLASMDLRDHQENHTTAVREALDRQGVDYAAMDEDERVAFLTEAVLQSEPVIDPEETTGLSETAATVLRLFVETAAWQREFGVDAVDTYCISMCEEPSHVLEVVFLADQADVIDLPDHSGLDVVPLLETEYALDGARRIMETLFENEAYAGVLAARGGTQEIMLGYSDSNKENGFLAARWALHRNQRRLARICAEHDVELRLFHGRGGSVSRGGDPTHDALLALPDETVTGQVKFTEQGEAIAEKFANPAVAERNLERTVTAQLRARYDVLGDGPTGETPTAWTEAMETAASAARAEYRDLLESEGFLAYFEQATPITVIEELNLGSRPASRSEDRSIGDLRAIPWVFSWTQSRCIVPGWYSLATGLDAYLEDGGDLDTLREMYREWPFFRTMLDSASLSLARTDMGVAARYADLADDDLRRRVFPRIEAEYDRAVALVRQISGRERLAESDWLADSLDRRNPSVDPLNVLQARLLGRENPTALEERTLRLTVKGVAAAMKSTG